MSNMVINTNVLALNSHRSLKGVGNSIAASSEKLSSGLRINRAADDAAGLAISEKMRAQIRGLDQASINAQDGVSLIQTAEGALQEVENMLQRMRELVVKASNAPLEPTDRNKITLELNQLTEEIDATAGRTEFNKKKLIDGSWAKNELYFQVGANELQGIKINIANMDATWLGVTKDQIGNIVDAAFSRPDSSTTTTTNIFNGKNAINFAKPDEIKSAAGTYEFANGAKMVIDDKGVITTKGFRDANMNGTFDTQNRNVNLPALGFVTDDGLTFQYVAGPDNKGTLTFTDNRSAAVNGQTKPIATTTGSSFAAGATTIAVKNSAGAAVSIQIAAASVGTATESYRFNFSGPGAADSKIIAKSNTGADITITKGATYTATQLKNLFDGKGGFIELEGYQIKVNENGTIDKTAVLPSKAAGAPIATKFTPYVEDLYSFSGDGTTRYATTGLFVLDGNVNTPSNVLTFSDTTNLRANAGTYTFGDGEKLIVKQDGTIELFGFNSDGTNPITDNQIITGQAGKTYSSKSGVAIALTATGVTINSIGKGYGQLAASAAGNNVVTFEPTTKEPQPMSGKNIFMDNGGTTSDVLNFNNVLQLDNSSGIYEFSNGTKIIVNKDGTFEATGFKAGDGIYNTTDGSLTGKSFDLVAASGAGGTAIAFRYDADSNSLRYFEIPKNGTLDTVALVYRDGASPGEPKTGNTAEEIKFNKDTGKFTGADGKELTAADGSVLKSGQVISKLATRIDNAIEIVSSQRAVLGAFQNRLEYTIKSLDISSENLSASESRIRDTDMAKEMMNLTKKNVLSQAATTMLAQANQAPQNILQLLR